MRATQIHERIELISKQQVNGDLPSPPHTIFDTILVLDFGSQYVQMAASGTCEWHESRADTATQSFVDTRT